MKPQLNGWVVWRGKHKPTNGSYRVRRINCHTGKVIKSVNNEAFQYTFGRLPAHYPVPALLKGLEP